MKNITCPHCQKEIAPDLLIRHDRKVAHSNADELYESAVEIATNHKKVNAYLLQKRLGIGHNRSVFLFEALLENGIIKS